MRTLYVTGANCTNFAFRRPGRELRAFRIRGGKFDESGVREELRLRKKRGEFFFEASLTLSNGFVGIT